MIKVMLYTKKFVLPPAVIRDFRKVKVKIPPSAGEEETDSGQIINLILHGSPGF
jgi:hypothetical protein